MTDSQHQESQTKTRLRGTVEAHPTGMIGPDDPVSVQVMVLMDEADMLAENVSALRGLTPMQLAARSGELAGLIGDLLGQHREHLAFSHELAGRVELLELRRDDPGAWT